MRIAVPKGRLQNDSLALFAAAGYDVPTTFDLATRRLVFERGGVEWIFVRDCDVPVYVDHGAADAGIAGLDQIEEHACGAIRAAELPFGRCRMMLIGAPGAPPLGHDAKIATKYPRFSRRWLDARGVRTELVALGGSVELAAVLRLTSHVVDLVETGETARVHQLELQECIADIAPRLIVAKDSYRTRNPEMRALIARVEAALDRRPKETIDESIVA